MREGPVAKNPNLPLNVLLELSKDKKDEVVAAALSNKNMPIATVISFVGHKVEDIRSGAAKNPNLPAQYLVTLAKDEDRKVRESVAGNQNTPPEVLAELSKDKKEEVAIAALENKNIPVSAAIALVGHKDEDIRTAVAKNPKLPKEYLETLSKDKDNGVRESVASNKNTSDKVLWVLSDDSDDDVVTAVANNPKISTDLRKKIANNVVKIRFYDGTPKTFSKIKCDDLCDRKCYYDVDLDGFKLYIIPEQKSIGMTPTANSKQAIAKNDRFFFEQEVRRSGDFRVLYHGLIGRYWITLWYDITLSAGKEYEIYVDLANGEANVYLINPDGTTTEIQIHSPKADECSWMQKMVNSISK